MYRGNAQIKYLYDAEGITGFKVFQSYFYFVKDAQGSVRSVLRAEQSSVQTGFAVSEVARYDYDAWGNATATNFKNAKIDGVDVADFNPIRWKSQYFDTESGFYYIDGRYYSPEIRQYLSPANPESALANALTIYDINPYNLCLTNPLSVIYNNYTIKTQTELTYDPPKLSRWQAFWRSSWGKGIAAVLFFAATVLALECSLAYPALAGSVWASYGVAFGLTAVTLGVGAGIAGYRSARQGKGFWNGFAEHVHNNWSQEVAITSAIFIVSLGITTAKFAIENAVAKSVNSKIYNDAIEISKQAAIERAESLKKLTGKKPTMTSAALDIKTGQIYFGDSGVLSDNINALLIKQMPQKSMTRWSIANCAEFNAVNNALNSGARMNNLIVTTIRVKTLAMERMCDNCIISLRGILYTVSG